jgi:SAM-dependent methyltransferase
MNKELLELLACPVCHRELDLDSETTNGERVRSGGLICAQEHSFPIHQSVPVFASTERYVEAFSVPRQPRPGVPALPTRSPELDVQALTRDEFWRQTQVEPEDLRGKTVLDAGCGGGRFVELLSGHGARVVGVDVDLAGLDQASAALGAKPNVDLVQANLFRLPFRRGAFDFIYSLGVLHHTPDPKAAFLELVPLLKPGGRIAVWVYPRSPATPVSDILRPITTRIPPRSLLWLAWIVTASYGPLLRIPRLGRRL